MNKQVHSSFKEKLEFIDDSPLGAAYSYYLFLIFFLGAQDQVLRGPTGGDDRLAGIPELLRIEKMSSLLLQKFPLFWSELCCQALLGDGKIFILKKN